MTINCTYKCGVKIGLEEFGDYSRCHSESTAFTTHVTTLNQTKLKCMLLTRQLALIVPTSYIAQCHILGVRTQGAMTNDPQLRTRPRFLYNTPTPSFIILCLLVRKLSCWQIHKPTNKQKDAAENIQALRYDTTLGKDKHKRSMNVVTDYTWMEGLYSRQKLQLCYGPCAQYSPSCDDSSYSISKARSAISIALLTL